MTISVLTLLANSELLFQYPVDGAKDHIEMAQRVLDCDYLCPNFVTDKAQDVVNKVCTIAAPFNRGTPLEA